MNSRKDQTKPFSKKAAEFLEKKGFYVVLLGCLGVIGVTAFFAFGRASQDVPQSQVRQSTDERLSAAQTPAPTVLAEAVVPSPVPTLPPSLAQRTPAPTVSPAPSPTAVPAAAPKETDALLPAPVEGDVVLAFAKDTLLYSPTLDQWTSHLGLDIAAPQGSAVRAVAKGVVLRVENDPLMGYCIALRHEDELLSVYANLDALPALQAGDSVKAGEQIGKVGTSAIAESAEAAHLHFELYESEKAIDPLPRLRGLTAIPVK